jgi:hypothetical protein
VQSKSYEDASKEKVQVKGMEEEIKMIKKNKI